MLLYNKLYIPILKRLSCQSLLSFLFKKVPAYEGFDLNNSKELLQNVWFSCIFHCTALEPDEIPIIIVFLNVLIIFILSSQRESQTATLHEWQMILSFANFLCDHV